MSEAQFDYLPIVRIGTNDTISSHKVKNNPNNKLISNTYLKNFITSLSPAEDNEKILNSLPYEDLQTYLETKCPSKGDNNNYLTWFLIIDQFEEILIHQQGNRDEQRVFFQELGKALQLQNIWFLFVMREEYIARLDPYLKYLKIQLDTRYRLNLLSRKASKNVIKNIFFVNGKKFVEEDLDKLVKELSSVYDKNKKLVSADYIAPMHLQIVCRKIWSEIPEKKQIIKRDHNKSNTTLTDALIEFYNEQLERLNLNEHERKLRDWISNNLLFEETKRRHLPLKEATSTGIEENIIRKLIQNHILNELNRHNYSEIEISHDRLAEAIFLANKAWFEANLDKAQKRAKEWSTNKNDDELLLKAYEIERVTKLWEKIHIEAYEIEFLDKSQQKINEEKKTKRIKAFIQICIIIIVIGSGNFFVINEKSKALEAANNKLTTKQDELTLKKEALEAANNKLTTKQDELTLKKEALEAANSKLTTKQDELTLKKEELEIKTKELTDNKVKLERTLEEKEKLVIYQTNNSLTQKLVLWSSLDPEVNHIDDRAAILSRQAYIFAKNIENHDRNPVALADQAMRSVLSKKIIRQKNTHFIDTPKKRIVGSKGNTIAVTKDDHYIDIYTSLDFYLKPFEIKLPQTSSINAITTNKSQDLMAIVTGDSILVWDIENTEKPKQLNLGFKIDNASFPLFSHDSELVTVVTKQGQLVSFNLKTGKSNNFAQLNDEKIIKAVFHPSKIELAAYTDKGNLVKFIKKGKEVTSLKQISVQTDDNKTISLFDLSFSPDGNWLAYVGKSTGKYVNIIPYQSSKQQKPHSLKLLLDNSDSKYWTKIAFSIDGHNLALADTKGNISTWKLADYDKLIKNKSENGEYIFKVSHFENLKSDKNPIVTLYYLSSSELISIDNQLSIRNFKFRANSNHYLAIFNTSLKEASVVYDLNFVPESHNLLVGSNLSGFHMWNVENKAKIKDIPYKTSKKSVRKFAFSSDKNYLAVGYGKGFSQVFDLSSKKHVSKTFKKHTDGLWSVVFSKNSSLFATADYDGKIYLWDAEKVFKEENYQPILVYENIIKGDGQKPIKSPVLSLKFIRDNKQLVASGKDGLIRMWNVDELTNLSNNKTEFIPTEIGDHQSQVNSIAFSQDDQLFASGGDDAIIKIWKLTDSKYYKQLVGHAGKITKLVFSPDNSVLGSAGIDGKVRLWNMNNLSSKPVVLDAGNSLHSLAFSHDSILVAAGDNKGKATIWYAKSSYFSEQICNSQLFNKNLTEAEWESFVGTDIDYQCTCPNLIRPYNNKLCKQ